jgi:hypothetical protein
LLYHRWSFISIIAAALGRNLWLPFGEDNIYPNHFITLVGPPGARKSTAINIAARILLDSGYEHFAGDSSSKEKFIMDWEHGFDKINNGIEPGVKNADINDVLDSSLGSVNRTGTAQAYIKAGELQDFLGTGNGGFIATLTNLWDNPPKYTDRFKNSKSIYLPNPTINLLGGATTTTFANIFSSNIIGQGMLSRLILVFGKGQRQKLTIPPPLSAELRNIIVQIVMVARTSLNGHVTLTQDAYKSIEDIYNSGTELQDARLATYSARRLTHLLKLCIVCAAIESSTVIEQSTVLLANTILTYTELYMPKALGEFGKSKSSEQSQIVMDAIYGGEDVGGLTLLELMSVVSQDIDNQHHLAEIVQKLVSAGKVYLTKNKSPGTFMPVKKLIKTKNSSQVDFNLLYEYKFKEMD